MQLILWRKCLESATVWGKIFWFSFSALSAIWCHIDLLTQCASFPKFIRPWQWSRETDYTSKWTNCSTIPREQGISKYYTTLHGGFRHGMAPPCPGGRRKPPLMIVTNAGNGQPKSNLWEKSGSDRHLEIPATSVLLGFSLPCVLWSEGCYSGTQSKLRGKLYSKG